MRVLQVCPAYRSHFGGVEEHVKNISERLARTHDVTVACTDPVGVLPKEEVINGVQIRRFKSWAPSAAYYLSNGLARYLKDSSEDFEIVHAHNYHAFPALYASQAKSSNSLVFTPHYHGRGHTFFRDLLHVPYKYVGKSIFERADRVVCVSRYEESLVKKAFQVEDKKITVIPNGIDPNEFEGLSNNKERIGGAILYVGRLEKYKGLHYVIESLRDLDKDIQLEVVGTGPYENALVKLAKKLGVTDRIRFFHAVSRHELLERYAAAQLFVLLSKYEAYGMSVGEALAAGTPCIVANTSALSEWVDGENCFGIDYPVDTRELVCMIDRAMGRKISSKLRLPTWDKTVDMLTALYDELCAIRQHLLRTEARHRPV